MTDKPDFAALRAARDEKVRALMQEQADKWGVPLQSLVTTFRFGGCYCACPTGPCEHQWDGPEYVSDDGCGRLQSATCSLCGCTAFSHDMRNAE